MDAVIVYYFVSVAPNLYIDKSGELVCDEGKEIQVDSQSGQILFLSYIIPRRSQPTKQ
jgi:hypothetical protein